MDVLKKLFPLSFKAKDVASLIIYIIIYLVVGAIGGVLIGVLAGLPIIGIIFILIGSLIDIYVLAGIVIAILDYLKVLK